MIKISSQQKKRFRKDDACIVSIKDSIVSIETIEEKRCLHRLDSSIKKILSLIISLIFISQLSAQTPIASYPFNNNANDESGNNNHGTLNGAIPTTDRFGNENSAYYFNGSSDYIELPTSETMLGSSPDAWTYSMFFKPTDFGSGNTQVLISDYYTTYDVDKTHALHLAIDNNDSLYCSIRKSTGSGSYDYETYISTGKAKIDKAEWYHAVVVVNKTTSELQLYLNAALLSTNTIDGTFNYVENQSIRVGCYYNQHNGGLVNFFKGTIDDVKLYNRALTAKQVFDNYFNETPDIVADDFTDGDYTNNPEWTVYNDGTAIAPSIVDVSGNNKIKVYRGANSGSSCYLQTSTIIGSNNFYHSFTTQGFTSSSYDRGRTYLYDDSGLKAYLVYIDSYGDQIQFGAYEWDESGTTATFYDIATKSISLNDAEHKAEVYKIDSMYYVYLDGDFAASGSYHTSKWNDFITKLEINSHGSGSAYGVYFDDIILKSTEANLADSSLAASYPFNGNANDESGNGNNGTVNGATLTMDRFGNENSAYSFDGADDYIQGPEITIDTQFTVSLWYKTMDNDGIMFCTYLGSIPPDNGVSISTSDNDLKFGDYSNQTITTNGKDYSDGKWNHLVCYIKNATAYIYFNNSLVGYGTVNRNKIINDFKIGRRDDNSQRHFNGLLDDIQIYNRALSEAEVHKLYANYHAPDTLIAEANNKQITLKWSNERIAGMSKYRIFRDGVIYDSVMVSTSNDTVFIDNNVSNYQTYSYFISSVDSLGNESVHSDTITKAPNGGLIAYYPFNGSPADSVGNNNGVNYGATLTSDRFGRLNKAYEFQNDSIIIETNESFVFTEDFTINYWTKLKKRNTGYALNPWVQYPLHLVNVLDKYNQNICFDFDDDDAGEHGFWFYCDGSGANHIRTGEIGDYTDDQWHNVCLTRINGLMQLYIDTAAIGTLSYSGTLGTNCSLYIGKQGWVEYSNIEGKVDDIRIFNRGLSSDEVDSLYTIGGWKDTPVDLIASYPFNGNANDESGNGNNGTVNGATLTTDRFGNENSAYSFDGADDYVDIGNNIKPGFPITVCGWINPNNIDGNRTIFRNDDINTCADFSGISIQHEDGKLAGWIGTGSGSLTSSRRKKIADNQSFIVENWAYFSVIFVSSDSINLYINGRLVYGTFNNGTGSALGYSSSSGAIGIRYTCSSFNEQINGEIDDIQIYNTALDSSQIFQLYGNYHAPDTLIAQADNEQITLKWSSERIAGLSKYRIFRDGSIYDSVMVSTPNDTVFIDNNVSNYQSYSYFISSVDSLGNESVHSDTLEIFPCEIVTDIDGNTYRTTKIGEQLWMAENLRVTKYPDGSAIPKVTDNTEWVNLEDNNEDDAYCFFYNDSASYAETYGALYTYAAAVNTCPLGWTLPSDEDWKELEIEIGMSVEEINLTSWRGLNEGEKLKSNIGWFNEGNGTDDYGFYALPASGRSELTGGYYLPYHGCSFWWSSSSINTSDATNRQLLGEIGQVGRNYSEKSKGYSVRCIKSADISLVASYPFNGNTNDESGNGNNGTVNGAIPTTDRFGNENSAYSFDGVDDEIDIEAGILGGKSTLSVSSWVKLNSVSGYDDAVIGDWASESISSMIIFKDDTDGVNKDYWRFIFRNANGEAVNYPYSEEMKAETDIWTHLAYSFQQNGTGHIWINGILVSTLENIPDYPINSHTTTPLKIGNSGNENRWFNGSIDDIQIYNHALSEAEVHMLYANYHAPDTLIAEAGNEQITLKWSSERIAGMSKYRIFRDGEIYDSVMVSTANDTVFIDNNVSNYQSYSYFISSVDSLGNESVQSDTLEIFPCEIVTDIDANTYRTTKIGEQIWMAENLRVTKYPDGSAIPKVTDNTAWANLGDNDTDAAYCYYNNDSTSYASTYGALYTYAAAKDACPVGWVLPSDDDWKELEVAIGMSVEEADNSLWRGTLEGNKLKSDIGWSGTGTNDYLFSAMPGGNRDETNGTFSNAGNRSDWWSTRAYSDLRMFTRSLTNDNGGIYRYYLYLKSHGFSVRCIKSANTSLVASYPFNGNANDESGNGNNGTVNGATPTTDRFGSENAAYSFDGVDDYVNLGNDNLLKPDSSITISLWVQHNDPTLSQVIIINSQAGATADFAYGIRSASGGTYFGIGNGSSTIANYSHQTNKNWNSIVGTFNRGEYKYYINGILVHDSVYSHKNIRSTTVDVVLGCFPGFGQFYDGKIDDIQIYNRALSEAEVHKLYSNYHAPDTLIAEAENNQITLKWSSERIAGLSKYRIFRDGTIYDSVMVSSLTDTSFIDTDILAGISYQYYLTSVDSWGNESQSSDIIEIMASAPIYSEILYEQTDTLVSDTIGFPSYYGGFFNIYNVQSADDFTVPDQGWDIYGVKTICNKDAVYFDSIMIVFYNNNEDGVPGNILQQFNLKPIHWKVLALGENKYEYFFDLPTQMKLDSGTYWLSVISYGTTSNYWLCLADTTDIGYKAKQKDINFVPITYPDWSDKNDSGNANGLYNNLAFTLIGPPVDNDLAVNEIADPVTGVTTSNQSITIAIKNKGLLTQKNFNVRFIVKYGPFEQTTTIISPYEEVSDSIMYDSVLYYTFTNTVDMSALSSYEITAIVSAANDTIYENDTAFAQIINYGEVHQMGEYSQVTTCGGVFVDNGGVNNNYSYGSDIMTLYPENAGDRIALDFQEWDLNSYSTNTFIIYDGEDTLSSVLYSYVYDVSSSDFVSPGFIRARNNLGAITIFHKTSDYVSGMNSGWLAYVSCVAPENIDFMVLDVEVGKSDDFNVENEPVAIKANIVNAGAVSAARNVNLYENNQLVNIALSDTLAPGEIQEMELTWYPSLVSDTLPVVVLIEDDPQATNADNFVGINVPVFKQHQLLESFENLLKNARLPIGWESTTGDSYVSNYWDDFHGDSILRLIGNDTIILPRMKPVVGDSLRFYSRLNSGDSVAILVSDGISEPWSVLDYAVDTTWDFSPFSFYIGDKSDKPYFFALANINPAEYTSSYFDYVRGGQLHYENYDVAAVSFTGDRHIKTNTEALFNLTIFNADTNLIHGNDYLIELKTEDSVLFTLIGFDIEPREIKSIELPMVFNTPDSMLLYCNLVSENDLFLENNRSSDLEVIISDDFVVTNPVTGTVSNLIYTYYKSSISEMIYYPSEINCIGDITGIEFTYSFDYDEEISNLPLKVYVAKTLDSLLLDTVYSNWDPAWIETDSIEFNKVFDQELTIETGASNSLYLPFNEPVSYWGDTNIVILVHKDTLEYANYQSIYFDKMASEHPRFAYGYSDTIIDTDTIEVNYGGGISYNSVPNILWHIENNNTPRFLSTPVTETEILQNYEYKVTTQYSGGGQMQLSAIDLPNWLSFTNYGDSALLYGVPDTVGVFKVKLELNTDSIFTETQTFYINVNVAPPVFISTPDTTAIVNEPYIYVAEIDYQGTESVSFTGSEIPTWLTLIDNGNNTAQIEGTPAATGTFNIYIHASVAEDTIIQEFNLTVLNSEDTNQTVYWQEDFNIEKWGNTVVQDDEGYQLNTDATLPDGWSIVDNNSLDYFWHWTNVGPRGRYTSVPFNGDAFLPATEIVDFFPEGTSSENGFFILESDYYNTDDDGQIANPVIDMDSYFQYGPIDFSNAPGVMFNAKVVLKTCCDNDASVALSLSVDYNSETGEGTWSDPIDLNEDYANNIHTPVEYRDYHINVSKITANESELMIAGESNVYFRIHKTNASHYYVIIDDITFYKSPEHDLVLEDAWADYMYDATQEDFNQDSVEFYNFWGGYTEIPQSVISEYVKFRGAVYNNGTNDAFEAILSNKIYRNGNLISTYSSDQYYISKFDRDTFSIASDFVPYEKGKYEFLYELNSESEDTLENHTWHYNFNVVDSMYSRVNIDSIEKWDQAGPADMQYGCYDGDVIAQVFDFPESVENVKMKGVSFYFASNGNTELNAISNGDFKVIGRVYEASASGIVSTSIQTSSYTLTVNDTMSWVNLYFNDTDDLTVSGGKTYLIGLETYIGADPSVEYRKFEIGNDITTPKQPGNVGRLYLADASTWINSKDNYAINLIVGTVESNTISATFNVDVNDADINSDDHIYLTGSFINWAEPGSDGSIQLFDNDSDGIYSTAIQLEKNLGLITYKYFKNEGWSGGEWVGTPDREATINEEDIVLNDIFGTLEPEQEGELKIQIVDKDGNYLNGVECIIEPANIQDISGTYGLLGPYSLPVGWYNYNVNKSGYFNINKQVEVIENEISNVYIVYPQLGDFNADGYLNLTDIDSLITKWRNEDDTYEMGPGTGSIPEFKVEPDNLFDFEDLMVFGQMWSYTNSNKSTTEYKLILDDTIENQFNIIGKQISDGNNGITFKLDILGKGLVKCSYIKINYDPEEWLLVDNELSFTKYSNSITYKSGNEENGLVEFSTGILDYVYLDQSDLFAILSFEKLSEQATVPVVSYEIRSANTSTSTGIVEISKGSDNLIIYPNPTDEYLHIESLSDIHPQVINIYDISGKEVYYNYNLNKENKVNVSSFDPGIFIIFVQYNDEMIIQRFIKN